MEDDMANYVNEAAFISWYNSVSKQLCSNTAGLLEQVHKHYCDTHSEEFTIPAENSKTGKAESYPFIYDDIGCCGASTVYIYF